MQKLKLQIPDLEKTSEWVSYLMKLKNDKKEMLFEQQTAITLLRVMQDEIDKVENILDALGETQCC